MRPHFALSFALAAVCAPAQGTAAVSTHRSVTAAVPIIVIEEGPVPVRIGGMPVAPGRYEVRLDETRERIVLVSAADGRRTYTLTAFLRRAKTPVTNAQVHLGPADSDTRRVLVLRLPSGTEWVA